MNAREFDRMWKAIDEWFSASRLRAGALIFAVVVLTFAVISYSCDALSAATDFEHRGEPHTVPDWNPLRYYEWALVALVIFVVPLANAILLGIRSGTSGVRSVIREAFTNRRKLKDANDRIRNAEMLSDLAERETARIQTELDRIMA